MSAPLLDEQVIFIIENRVRHLFWVVSSTKQYLNCVSRREFLTSRMIILSQKQNTYFGVSLSKGSYGTELVYQSSCTEAIMLSNVVSKFRLSCSVTCCVAFSISLL